jgi:hypothetical protein
MPLPMSEVHIDEASPFAVVGPGPGLVDIVEARKPTKGSILKGQSASRAAPDD